MHYELNQEQLLKAKDIVKKLKKSVIAWKFEKEKAETQLEKSAAKFHHNIKSRIKEYENKISDIENKIIEFETAIKDKKIDI